MPHPIISNRSAISGEIADFSLTTLLSAWRVTPKCRAAGKIEHLEAAYIGQGLHFIQEDQPDAIGRAISDWMRRN